MSDTLAGLRHQITGAKKLKTVVRTMKVLAASSIHQYESAVNALVDYQRTLDLGLAVCLRRAATTSETRKSSGTPPSVTAVIFGSDQGLVGRFNEIIVSFAAQTLEHLPGAKRILAVGERLDAYLSDAALPQATHFPVPASVAALPHLVGQIQLAIENDPQLTDASPVYIFHHRPHHGILYEPMSQRALPLDYQWQVDLLKLKWPTNNLPEVLADDIKTMRALVREYFFIALFKACAESLASENASRLAAMQRAEKNIDDLSASLVRAFNRQRQATIDDELFDLIAGYEALKKPR